MAKAHSAEDYQLIHNLEAIKTTLEAEEFSERIKRPLGFWIRPEDRRLPLAFLDRPIEQIIETPFNQLISTPGIGLKKIETLIKLLHRVTQQEPTSSIANEFFEEPRAVQAPTEPTFSLAHLNETSESLWDTWRQTIRQQKLDHIRLGNLAPSLKVLPKSYWDTPLSTYFEHSIAEIREMRAHGEKRVQFILETVYQIYTLLNKFPTEEHIHLTLQPRLIFEIENWISRYLCNPYPCDRDVLVTEISLPLCKQIDVDFDPTIVKIVMQKIGTLSPPQSVASQARELGITRARVYQLIEDCARAVNVRWPSGVWMLPLLQQALKSAGASEDGITLIYEIEQAFYPDKLTSTQLNNHQPDQEFSLE